MFADDTKIFREIKTLGDASSIKKDLSVLPFYIVRSSCFILSPQSVFYT